MNNVKKSIGWADFTINPIKGLCPMVCDYCYARRFYKRFKWNPEIRYDALWWEELEHIKKPSRIFIGSTIELFGNWVRWEWLKYIFQKCEAYSQHTFIFLTKQPWEAKQYEFPDNAWLGVTVDNMSRFGNIQILNEINVKHRFVSFEPLLDFTPPDLRGIDWVIIGQQTPVNIKMQPKIEWIKAIEDEADKLGIPVFEKNNLRAILGDNLRRNFRYHDEL